MVWCYRAHPQSEFSFVLTHAYSNLRGGLLLRSGVRPRWTMLRAITHFLRAFVQRGGWRDGTFGPVYSALIGLYPLILYAKLWEKGKRS